MTGERLVWARLARCPSPHEGPLTEPTAGAQRWPRERVLMPHLRHSPEVDAIWSASAIRLVDLDWRHHCLELHRTELSRRRFAYRHPPRLTSGCGRATSIAIIKAVLRIRFR